MFRPAFLAAQTVLAFAACYPASASPDHPARAVPDPSAGLFAGFGQRCPHPVVFRSNLNVSQATRDVSGTPVIILDPLLNRLEERFRRDFLAAHECAHHVFGHTSRASRISRATVQGVTLHQELAADCWAAELFGRLGRRDDANAMSESFARGGRVRPGSGYPAGIERARTVARCYRAGERIRQARAVADPAAATHAD